jgi:hypothetical protein
MRLLSCCVLQVPAPCKVLLVLWQLLASEARGTSTNWLYETLTYAAAVTCVLQVPAPAKVLLVLGQLLAAEAEGASAGRPDGRASGADWELGEHDDDDDDDEEFETDEEGEPAAAGAFSSPMAGMQLKGLG